MFENLSTVTKILMGATAVGAVLTTVSVIKDKRDNALCIEECECCGDADIADPTVDLGI